jgi:hypothetical protein
VIPPAVVALFVQAYVTVAPVLRRWPTAAQSRQLLQVNNHGGDGSGDCPWDVLDMQIPKSIFCHASHCVRGPWALCAQGSLGFLGAPQVHQSRRVLTTQS